MNEIIYKSIGTIRTPFKSKKGMPIQPSGAQGVRGTIEMLPDHKEGLQDLEGFSHIILIYHFHMSKGYDLIVTPFLDNQNRGVFATRAPRRPNPIGLSVVKLNAVKGNILDIENVDIIDGTPLLDLKPYVPDFDAQSRVKVGWLEKKKDKVQHKKSDNRFS